jgi:uncharacterized protein YcbK (DUF882 family)
MEPVSISQSLVDVLEDLRGYAWMPLVINSGFRCPAHNAAVGGKPNSAHLTGEAADIFIAGNLDRFKLLEAVAMCGVTRYGIDQGFIHIDVSTTLPQDVAWLYGAGE